MQRTVGLRKTIANVITHDIRSHADSRAAFHCKPLTITLAKKYQKKSTSTRNPV